MKQKSVLVIGAGFMGAGIAQVCAQSGYLVFLNDVTPDALGKAEKSIQWSVNKLHEKTFLQEEPKTLLSRISYVTDFASASEVDWVIEAIPEHEALKIDLFLELEKKCLTWNKMRGKRAYLDG